MNWRIPCGGLLSRAARAGACALLVLGLVAERAAAQDVIAATYRVGIDADNSSATGCPFFIGDQSAALPGFEYRATVVVDGVGARVVSSTLERCQGGSFVATSMTLPTTLGLGLLDQIDLEIPGMVVGGVSRARLAFFAQSSDGGQDSLTTVDGLPTGAPIVSALPFVWRSVPTLSAFGIALLAGLVAAFAMSGRGRRGSRLAAVLVLAAFASTTLPWAWAVGFSAIASDPAGDGAPQDARSDLRGAFVGAGDNATVIRLQLATLRVPPGTVFRHIESGKYLRVDLATRQLLADADSPLGAFRRFEVEDLGGQVRIRAVGDGTYLRSASPRNVSFRDPFMPDTVVSRQVKEVFADASQQTASLYVLFAEASGDFAPAPVQKSAPEYSAFIFEVGPSSLNQNAWTALPDGNYLDPVLNQPSSAIRPGQLDIVSDNLNSILFGSRYRWSFQSRSP